MDLHKTLVKLTDDLHLGIRYVLDAELDRYFFQKPFRRDRRMNDDEQGGFILLFREFVQHSPREGGLPCADVTDEDCEAFHGIHGIFQAEQGMRVLLAVEVEPVVGRIREGLSLDPVKLQQTHLFLCFSLV